MDLKPNSTQKCDSAVVVWERLNGDEEAKAGNQCLPKSPVSRREKPLGLILREIFWESPP